MPKWPPKTPAARKGQVPSGYNSKTGKWSYRKVSAPKRKGKR